MKKILAVVLSLAMILSMTVSSFAAAPLPTNTEADWAEYFTEVYTSDALDAEAQANAIAVSMTMTDDMYMLLRALNAAIRNAEQQGVDTTETNIALAAILAEYDINLEQALGEDLDGDGYLGDPAEGVIYVPTEPTDVEAWTTYYTIILGEASTNPTAVITVVPEIAGNVTSGAIDMDTFKVAFPEAAKTVGGDVVNQIVWGVEELLSADLNSDGHIGKPIGDAELPEEDTSEGEDSGISIGGGDFLNTILGILGSIGDMLFGGSGDNGGSTGGSDDSTDDDNLWGEESGDDMWGEESGDTSTIPDTGDTTVFAVAAVALAAGAALVMTRKKSEDAE